MVPPKTADIAEKGYLGKPTMCRVCRVPGSSGTKNQIGRNPTVALGTIRVLYSRTTFAHKCAGV
jgi:hypothetical protein